MKVTCVIFFYNEERYIEQAIESVINQTMNVDEIIVSDDYSTDSSPHIIKDLAVKYPQIKYVLSEKKGKFHAYKTGLKYVSNPYFFIMAGDDAVENDYVQNGLDYLRSGSLDLFYSAYKICDLHLDPQDKFLGPKEGFTTKDLLYRNWVGGFLFGKASIIADILCLEDDRILFEDWVGSIMFSNKYGLVQFNQQPKYLYRRHPNATTVRMDRMALRKRDIKLYEYLLVCPYMNFDYNERELILERIALNKLFVKDQKLWPSILKLLISNTVRLTEKFKLLLMVLGFKNEKRIISFLSFIKKK